METSSNEKTLVALAVLSAAGIASAQSSVTVYGAVDDHLFTFNTKTTDGAGASSSLRQTKIESGGFGSSRFGLTGSEDLGGGLKASFQLECGLSIDTGAGAAGSVFNRMSSVGLSGGFGSLRLGRMWSPYDEVNGIGAGAFNEIFTTSTGTVFATNNYNANPRNSINYTTSNISGFSAALSYSLGENKTGPTGTPPNTDAGSIISANVQYARGPIAVSLSHQQEKANGAATALKLTKLNTACDLGVAKLRTGVGQAKNGSTGLLALARTPRGKTCKWA